jgi:hypothetical protein
VASGCPRCQGGGHSGDATLFLQWPAEHVGGQLVGGGGEDGVVLRRMRIKSWYQDAGDHGGGWWPGRAIRQWQMRKFKIRGTYGINEPNNHRI